MRPPSRSCLAARPLAEQRELILLGDLLAEHPQHPVQLLLFVNITGGDRIPESESNLIHSCRRVSHKLILIPYLSQDFSLGSNVQAEEAKRPVAWRDLSEFAGCNLRDPEVLARQIRLLEKWIDALE
jgi:hypothetical protein